MEPWIARGDGAHQFLERRMQLASCVLENHADGAVGAILLDDRVHELLGVVLIRAFGVFFDDAHTHDLVPIVDQLIEKPLQGVVGVCVLVYSDHESTRSSLGLVSPMAHIECEGGRVALRCLAEGEIVECDMLSEPG